MRNLAFPYSNEDRGKYNSKFIEESICLRKNCKHKKLKSTRKHALRDSVQSYPAPLVSVVITAHNRKEFLTNAVSSVLNQNVSKKYYEIIVSKNFEDTKIDSFLEKNNVKCIYDKQIGIGPRISKCISMSKGAIISFLEDDDSWTPERLSIVIQEFLNDPNLGYYHNAYIPINDKGEITKEWIHHKNIRKTIRLKPNYALRGQLAKVMKYSPDFNLSSICISRDFALQSASKIASINYAVDVLLFFESVYNGYGVMLDHRRLTMYTIHESTMNKRGTFDEFESSSLELYSGHLVAFGKILEFIDRGDLKQFVSSYQKEWVVRIEILRGKKGRWVLLRTLTVDAKLFFIRRDYSKFIYMFGWFSFFFPKLTKYAYHFYLKNSLVKYAKTNKSVLNNSHSNRFL